MGKVDPQLLGRWFEQYGNVLVLYARQWLGAIVPTADTRRVISEMMPQLPAEIGGGPSSTLTNGVQWLAVSANVSPTLSVRIVAKSKDAESAKALQNWVNHAKAISATQPAVQAVLPDIAKIAATITPKVVNDRLEVTLDEPSTDALISQPLKFAQRSRDQAESLQHISEIGKAWSLYIAAHNETQAPPDLQTLVTEKMLDTRMLVNPLNPAKKPGYIYIPSRVPLDKLKPNTIVLYEAHDTWPAYGIGVLRADTTASRIPDEVEFKKQLKAALGESP